jgi:competence protein ComEA
MKHWFYDYFNLTKREYNALLALFGLIFLTIVTPYVYEKFFIKEEVITPFEQRSISALTFISEQHGKYPNNNGSNRFTKPQVPLFKFDPNYISVEDWQKLGLSPKQAQSIINYRNRGGKFARVEDLKKMYVISPQLFERLQPFVKLSSDVDNNKPSFEARVYPKKELPIIEVNTADTTSLDRIKGVGTAFARRIVNYRNRLGGFYKKEQLREVYGIDSLKFEEIKGQVSIDVSAMRKININTVDFDGLKNHPYLKYKQINAIIQYRKQHGSFTSIDDLKKILILSPQTIEQLTPYLQF